MVIKLILIISSVFVMVFHPERIVEKNSTSFHGKSDLSQWPTVQSNSCSSFSTYRFQNRKSTCLERIRNLPPPGGTVLNSNIKRTLWWSNRLFHEIQYDMRLNRMSFEVIVDADFNGHIAGNKSGFRKMLSRYLGGMTWKDFFVHDLEVQEGSIRILFNVSRLAKPEISDYTSLKNRRSTIHLMKRNILSSTNKREIFDDLQTSQHKLVKRAAKIIVNFQVDANYPDVAGGRQKEFKDHLQKEVAKGIRMPLSSIQDFSINPGMIVSFSLSVTNDDNNIMDEGSVLEAAEDLQNRVKSNRLRLTDLEGRSLVPSQSSVVTSKEEKSMTLSYATFGILIALLIMMGILVLFAAMLIKNHAIMRETKTTKSRTKAYQDCAIQETGRESMLSMSGRYSYDSGLWMGPGPEPSFMAPEETFYRPPTREQLASTPRPGTAVRTRLKRSWNIDSDQSLTPIPDGGEVANWEDNNDIPFSLATRSVSEATSSYARN